ncbi:hypothetical protein [Streptomyces sp. NPDC059761]|uniref:hypothetical protein n=1 Tax=Streptomyces sp. NPDC059761 TaxID=3346937 RepID=UPI00365BC41C
MNNGESTSITVQGPYAHPDRVRAVHYALEGQDCTTRHPAECYYEEQARKAIDTLKAWEACHDSFLTPNNDFDIVIDPSPQTIAAHAVTLHRLRRHLPFPRGYVVLTGSGEYGHIPMTEDNSMRPGLVHFRANRPTPDTESEKDPT